MKLILTDSKGEPVRKQKEWPLAGDSSPNISESQGTDGGRWVDVVEGKGIPI